MRSAWHVKCRAWLADHVLWPVTTVVAIVGIPIWLALDAIARWAYGKVRGRA